MGTKTLVFRSSHFGLNPGPDGRIPVSDELGCLGTHGDHGSSKEVVGCWFGMGGANGRFNIVIGEQKHEATFHTTR